MHLKFAKCQSRLVTNYPHRTHCEYWADAKAHPEVLNEAEMFARMQHMTEDTMVNTEMFYAPDASDRVVALFRSFGGAEAVPPAAEA